MLTCADGGGLDGVRHRKEVVYGITGLTADQAGAAQLWPSAPFAERATSTSPTPDATTATTSSAFWTWSTSDRTDHADRITNSPGPCGELVDKKWTTIGLSIGNLR
ncbi:hypothetical protein [Nonomuraea lactucae]|uniref:hypothetical protein n=1 Tax=Nonomuraea lactucae TaxID=2249762 RepID=UPI001F054135|nr:hypothetical protein [Nonomuraea lactucae]